MDDHQKEMLCKLADLQSLINASDPSRNQVMPFASNRRLLDPISTIFGEMQDMHNPLLFPLVQKNLLLQFHPVFSRALVSNLYNHKVYPIHSLPRYPIGLPPMHSWKHNFPTPVIGPPIPPNTTITSNLKKFSSISELQQDSINSSIIESKESHEANNINKAAFKLIIPVADTHEKNDVDNSKLLLGNKCRNSEENNLNIDASGEIDSRLTMYSGSEKSWSENKSLQPNKEGIFYCHVCDYRGTNQEGFLNHLRGHYDFKCEKCDYASRTEGRLKRHIKDFHSEIPPENFSGQKAVKHIPKFHKCKHCSFVSESKDQHWKHQKLHLQPNKYLECPKCSFITEYKHHLEYHLRNHLGSKPYKCPKCNYQCVNKSMLNSHMKSHTNVYQYRCADCNYATKYCHSLKLHLLKQNHNPASVLNPDGSLPSYDNSSEILSTKRGPHTRGLVGSSSSTNMASSIFSHSLFSTSTTKTNPLRILPGLCLQPRPLLIHSPTMLNNQSNFFTNQLPNLPSNNKTHVPNIFEGGLSQPLVLDLTSKNAVKSQIPTSLPSKFSQNFWNQYENTLIRH